jgi:hypothetical protein
MDSLSPPLKTFVFAGDMDLLISKFLMRPFFYLVGDFDI